MEDWDEFDNTYKDLILSRFKEDTEERMGVISSLQKYISRFYRLSGTIDQIESGKINQHIEELDFNEVPAPQEYLFHRLADNRRVIGSND